VKISSLTVETDLGRRVVQFSPPLNVELQEEMPPEFRTLPELLWRMLCEVAAQGPSLTPLKVEA
jgi:hypothetical protein